MTHPRSRGSGSAGAARHAPAGEEPERSRGHAALIALAALGACTAAPLALMGWSAGARTSPWPAFLLWGAAWVALAAAWARARGTPLSLARAAGLVARAAGRDAPPGPSRLPRPTARRGGRAVTWAVAVAGRLALLPLLPHFSDDLYRFLWDGWVGIHGVNPFLHAPGAAELEGLRTTWHGLVNHPAVPTIYPPGAQTVFTALAALGPSVLLFKSAFVAADLGIGWALERMERRRPRAPCAALLWLWSPLVLVEVAWSGHLEPLGVLPMVAALLFLSADPHREPGDEAGGAGARGRSLAGGAFLGLGISVKFAPAVALPALWRRRGPGAAAVAVLLPLLLYLPYAGAGTSLFAGLGEYAARWEFNAGLFLPLRALLGGDAARAAAVAVPAAVAAVAVVRRWPVERALFWGVGAGLLLSPTIHPWYLLWVLPLALLRRSRAWLAWSVLVFLAYAGLDLYRATGRWPEPPALRLLIHLPFLLLLASEAVPVLRGRGPAPRP